MFASLQSGEPVTASFRGIHDLPRDIPLHFSVDPQFVHVFDGNGRSFSRLASR